MSAGMSPAFREALEPLLLSLADDELVIGHRNSEWTGWAPHIEEDIAFSSIAQDEIGHAAVFYKLLSELGDRTPDQLALGREPGEYRHAVICERPNQDWAYTLARHFLYETADRIRLTSLRGSSYKPLADLSEKLLREERYHQLHADAWFRRAAGGPVEGRHQFALAISSALPEALGLFEPLQNEPAALESGILLASSNDLMQQWLSEVMERIDQAGMPISLPDESEEGEFVATSTGELIESPHDQKAPRSIRRQDGRWIVSGSFSGSGGRHGKHTEDFAQLWDDLTKTYREEPAATW